MCLGRDLCILFIFSKNQLLGLLNFSVFPISISFISAPIFMISFLLIILGLFIWVLLVCKIFDYSIKSEWTPCWVDYFCCRFSPFIALNTLCHSFLDCRVSVEKSADNLMGSSLLCNLLLFFCSFSGFFFFFFLVFNFCNYNVPWCFPLWIDPFRDSMLPQCEPLFLSQVREIFSYYIFKYILCPFLFLFSFLVSYNVYVSVFDVVPEFS